MIDSKECDAMNIFQDIKWLTRLQKDRATLNTFDFKT